MCPSYVSHAGWLPSQQPATVQAAAIDQLGSRDAELTARKAALEAQAAKLQTWNDEVRVCDWASGGCGGGHCVEGR